MGTWGMGLYANDTAADLRDDFKDAVRAPWEGERLLAWALERYPGANDPANMDYSYVRLALADLFWLYGIDHPPTTETGLRIVAEGSDLAMKRIHGLSERDLKQRARVLDALAAKWQTPNPRPRPRHTLVRPEPFALEVGDCLVYPLRRGEPRNPYVGPRLEARYYGSEPWTPDGWGAACVLARWHRHDVFARYLVAVLRYDGATKPTLADIAGSSLLSYRTASGRTHQGCHVVSTTPLHLRRMQVDVIGHLRIKTGAVLWEFPPDRPLMRSSGGDFSSCAGLSGVRRPGAVQVDDPLQSYLA